MVFAGQRRPVKIEGNWFPFEKEGGF